MEAVLRGALAGTLATGLMSLVMVAAQKVGLMGEMPPEKITAKALDRFGITRSEEAQKALATVNHFAFGAAGGAIYSLVAQRLPGRGLRLLLGLAFGGAIWTVSYAGWVPALGIMQAPPEDRPGRAESMLTAHAVYGLATAAFDTLLRR